MLVWGKIEKMVYTDTAFEEIIGQIWDDRSLLEKDDVAKILNTLMKRIANGELTSAYLHKENADDKQGKMTVNTWVVKAVRLAFPILRKIMSSQDHFKNEIEGLLRSRIEDNASVRFPVYLEKGVVVMPHAFVNCGVFIDEDSMVDSNVTVGSCAYIGKRVHISSGAVIGGVFEPAGLKPVIIEDDVFIGAGAKILDGAHIKRGSVILPNVVITGTTRVYDYRKGNNDVQHIGSVPEYSMVYSGFRDIQAEGGCELQVVAPVIIRTVEAKTKEKLKINEDLHEGIHS